MVDKFTYPEFHNKSKIRKIVLLCDYGYKTGGEVIEIHPFVNRKERNEEICRLYYEKGVSQLFLANLFNMSQPSVSVIVNKK
mgnify:FL=1